MKWIIKSYMCKQHIDSISDLAKRTGLTRRVLYDRINHPETMKVFELDALDEVLHFEDADLIQIVRGR